MEYLNVILAAVVGLALGFGLAWVISRRIGEKSLEKIEAQAVRIVEEAKKEAAIRKKEATLEIREKTLKDKGDLNREISERRSEIEAAEKEVTENAASLQKKIDVIDTKEHELANRINTMQTREKGLELAEEQDGWHIIVPDNLQTGHESHFAEVVKRYLKYLQQGKIPAWETSFIKAKYYTTTEALKKARLKKK